MLGFEIYFYTCAGKKSHPDFDDWFSRFLQIPNLSKNDRQVLEYTLACSAAGCYPSWAWYGKYYPTPDHAYNLGELSVAYADIVDGYSRLKLATDVTGSLSSTSTTKELAEELKRALQSVSVASDASVADFSSWSYGEELNTPYGDGLSLGVPEVDSLTNGFQPGTVASICAFTGGGKTQLCLSMLFKNAKAGRKIVYVSLELEPKMVWLMLETRYMYEVKGIQLDSQDLLFHKLSGDKLKAVLAAEDDFKRDFVPNVLVVDTSLFTKSVFTNVDSLITLYGVLDKHLGGFDCIIYDHVNQFDLLFQDHGKGLGNSIIVNLRAACLAFTNSAGSKCTTVFAVQVNRAGFTRAGRRGGAYDLTAISDLNEIERTSAYCVFMYTGLDVAETQETKICMIKHRLGRILPEPVTAQFLPKVVLVGDNVELISYEGEFAQLGSMDDFGSSSDSLTAELTADLGL